MKNKARRRLNEKFGRTVSFHVLMILGSWLAALGNEHDALQYSLPVAAPDFELQVRGRAKAEV